MDGVIRKQHQAANRLGLLLAALFTFPNQLAPVLAAEETKAVDASTPSIALALGGGGVRAAASIGALRVLTEEKIPFDFVAGTSMGAIIGGLYCAGVPLAIIEEQLIRHDLLGSIISAPLAVQVSAQPFIAVGRAATGKHRYPGFYDSHRFAVRVDKLVPSENKRIESFPIRFAAVVVDLASGKEKQLSSGDLGIALQASCAIPIVCRPVTQDGSVYVDGGMLNNLPVQQARQTGAKFVIAVDADEAPQAIDESELKSYTGMSNRLVALTLWKLGEQQRKLADVIITPSMPQIRHSSRSADDLREAIKAGEKAARAALPEIRRQLAQVQQTEPAR